MREFIPLSTPIFMVGATYPTDAPGYMDDLAKFIEERSAEGEGMKLQKKEKRSWSGEIVVLTLEELLPLSFGPEQLEQAAA